MEKVAKKLQNKKYKFFAKNASMDVIIKIILTTFIPTKHLNTYNTASVLTKSCMVKIYLFLWKKI